jgi:mannose-6-phosphate isomerase
VIGPVRAPPIKLRQRMVEKVWGRRTLPAPFAVPGQEPIGEIWFEPLPQLSQLLVKYLFTSDKLSVQVHPSDADADVASGEAGKEECWLVLDAEPGAQLAIGFDMVHSTGEIAAAARDGSIEDLLTWHEVQAGDIFYLPAGTVHAIGSGLSLVEVQQNSDTTFRLYDYGRPRDLHLDRALAVADFGPYDLAHHSTVETSTGALIDGPYFRIDRVEGFPSEALYTVYANEMLALPLSGVLASSAGKPVTAEPGECLYAPSLDVLDFGAAEITLLIRPASLPHSRG